MFICILWSKDLRAIFGNFGTLILIRKWRDSACMFPGDKDNYINMCIIKIAIKTSQIDMDVCFFQKLITSKNHVCPWSQAFSIGLLICDFNLHRHGTKNS